MNATIGNEVCNWFETKAVKKLGLWLLLSIILSLIFFREFWTSLPVMLSPDWVLGQHHASSWGVLALCLVFLWFKRKQLWKGMGRGIDFIFILMGLALVAAALFIPWSRDYLVFQVLLASLGMFVILFGRGAKIPAVLLAIYCFAISFPLGIQRFAELPYSQTALVPLMGLMRVLGYPLQNVGQWLRFPTSSGEAISVAITSACAGPATMGVFMALFALMMLDVPLPPQKAAWLFLIGAVGTWFQSFIRLAFLILVGYHAGENALWTAHFWTIYIIFPLWYLFFAYIYFRQVGRIPGIKKTQGVKRMAAGE